MNMTQRDKDHESILMWQGVDIRECSKEELIEVIRHIMDSRNLFMDAPRQSMSIIADATKAKYDAYLSAGFSAEHALFLCKP